MGQEDEQIDGPVMGIGHSLCEQSLVCMPSLVELIATAFGSDSGMVGIEESACHEPAEASFGPPEAGYNLLFT